MKKWGGVLCAAAATAVLCALFCAAGVFCVRRIDVPLSRVSPALAEIFSALRQAEIVPVPWAPLVCAAGAVFSAMRTKKRTIWLLPAVILILMGLFTAVLSARVNGIVFFDVLRPLAKTAMSGGLDALG
ncbi:MAG: hypothetical protein II557_05230 [Clostridia bacterium]|nr:hypothetical protein [Clostridia bacterium]MBQ4350827.1 hypothetical protein [Clostridia bacterium]